MYLRAVHADASTPALRRLIQENPLGLLTTALPNSKLYPTLQTTHIPFLHDISDPTSETEFGVLRGHLARANPHSKALIEALETKASSSDGDGDFLDEEVMVLFNHPVQHYVTPKFYTETKPQTGKVVPTWNYAAAQVYGKARIYHDVKAEETGKFLAKQIRDLSVFAEEGVMGFDGREGRKGAWRVDDAPERYIELLQKSIIGIEIVVERLEGKFKMSQELKEGDREGVVEGFGALGTENGERVAEIVRERGELKKAGQMA